jgi:hypothetical protein
MLTSIDRSDDKIDDNKHGHRETTVDGCKSNTSNFSRLMVFYEQLCMSCAELHNRRLQVRFLSHLPLTKSEMKRLLADGLVSRFHVF